LVKKTRQPFVLQRAACWFSGEFLALSYSWRGVFLSTGMGIGLGDWDKSRNFRIANPIKPAPKINIPFSSIIHLP
jgi:hypothetical protein